MKDIFSYNADIEKNAYMNWRTQKHNHIHNMITLADGFMLSSLSLAKQTLIDNSRKQADILIYPILFNTNHAIEVYLKAISWSLNLLNGNANKFRTNHHLTDLLSDVKTLLNNYESNPDKLKQFNKMISPLDSYIKEVYKKIEGLKNNGGKKYNIDFSRYTLDVQFDPQFYINSLDNVVVDLENFYTVFKEIHKTLDTLATHYLQIFEEKNEVVEEVTEEV